ncbi:MAG: Ig-like domain-containing protein, partial [Magnetococcales bacterium]|nr:Ig-like domain-containing protein [Magnetococcales bacterium]
MFEFQAPTLDFLTSDLVETNGPDFTGELVTEATETGEVIIAQADLLLRGEYSRSGNDLIIEGENELQVVVEEYFSSSHPPILKTTQGAQLLPQTIQALLTQTSNSVMVAGPTLFPNGTQQTSIGQVSQMAGKASAKSSGDASRPLSEGDAIYAGEVIQTAENSMIKLTFNDNTEFRLGESARMILDKYVYDPGQDQGTFEATVTVGVFGYASGDLAHINKGQHSIIRTPTATIGIRGSELQGEVLPDGTTTVVHTSGLLDISDVNGQGLVTLLETGTATVVSFGAGAPQPVFRPAESFLNHLKSQFTPDKSSQEPDSNSDTDTQEPDQNDNSSREDGNETNEKSDTDSNEKTDQQEAVTDETVSDETDQQEVITDETVSDETDIVENIVDFTSSDQLLDLIDDSENSSEQNETVVALVESEESSYTEQETTTQNTNQNQDVIPTVLSEEQGIFLDSAVAGVTYVTSSGLSGTTGPDGSYDYLPGDTVTFSIGNIVLGSATGTGTITPSSFSGNSGDLVTNVIRLLQTLDDDGDPSNGINISESVRNSAATSTITLDVDGSSFENDVGSLITQLNTDPNNHFSLVSTKDAWAHFATTIGDNGLPVIIPDEISSSSPTVVNVTATDDSGNDITASVGIGEKIIINVTFDEIVNVSGSPILTLQTTETTQGQISGGMEQTTLYTDQTASYKEGSGTKTLSFEYTVQEGDVSADLAYISTTALSLNGGTIVDVDLNAADLTLPESGGVGSLSANESIIVDGVLPSLYSLSSADGDTIFSATENLILTFSEAVTVNDGVIKIVSSLDDETLAEIDVKSGLISGSGTDTITINPNENLDASGADYYILIDEGAFLDAAGNSITEIFQDDSWIFTSADTTAPTLASHSPTAGAEAVTVT